MLLVSFDKIHSVVIAQANQSLYFFDWSQKSQFEAIGIYPNAPRPPGAEAGRRPAVAGAAAFSKKAYVVFSYIHRESLM